MPVRDPDPAFFLAAIQSVLDQTWKELELILIETPGRRPLAGDLTPIEDPRVRHLVAPAGITTAMARNLGMREARGDLLAMLDADDLCRPDRLQKQHDHLRAHPQIDVLGTQIQIIDERDQVRGRRVYPLEHEKIFDTMRLYNPLAQPSVMMRKQVILDHGGYDERPDCICEDYDLWSRLARKGVCFANLDEDLTLYRVHSSATKHARLRESLEDTIRIKKAYWSDRFDLRARARLLAERVLLHLPRPIVLALFKRLYVKGS